MNNRNKSAGLSSLFWARSVAVIGASRNPEKLGYEILANIVNGGYQGDVFPVNPKAEEILGLTVYPSVDAVPGEIELAVVVIPAPLVPGVLSQASEKGARAAIVISGGFAESGRSDLEHELSTVAEETGLRILGPNCQGLNYRPNKLCASWPLVTAPGPLAVVSQSGTVAATVAGWAVDEAYGISAAVSLGNQLDLCETDFIEFLAEDKETRVIALYLEGANDGRRLLRAAERVMSNKPIVVLKSGRTEVGRQAATSHTRSLAGRDEVFDGACRQFGIVRVSSLESLYDSAKSLSSLRLNGGRRVVVVTSSGGAGILAVDEAERRNLEVPPLPSRAAKELESSELRPNAIIANPLDLTVAPAQDFQKAALVLSEYDVADLYLLIFGDPIPEAADAVKRVRQKVGNRVAVAYLGGGETEASERARMHQAGIPVFATPQRAIAAIESVVLWEALRLKLGEYEKSGRKQVA
jgi:acyl-CoA synthetase (NDP forming)